MSARPAWLREIEAITFDCYGTLIDWEGGAKKTLGKLLEKSGVALPGGVEREELLERFFQAWERAQWERIQQSYARYRAIAHEAFCEAAAAEQLSLGAAEANAFTDSIATSKPFPDVPAALRILKREVKLGIISNIDDDILAASVKLMGVEFDLLMTAEQARAYKPSAVPFERARAKLGLPAAKVAHAAFGFEYDIGTAARLGFRTVLVRRTRKEFPTTPVPDLIVADLTELAAQFE
ncbi:MAG: HAD hydrolase-like protein [Acidobacteria bacterium]|nr:HAD hydrolase-like protein [Acidobacteriota bacterium]